MRQVAILSGKGGTGKTTVTSSLAALAGRAVIADCDVEASNMPLLLNPEIRERREFETRKAEINPESCLRCGLCVEECRFDAIREFQVDPMKCEGCGACAYICPTGAVRLRPRVSGYLYVSETRYGPLCHADLLPGESSSGRLVSLVRERARDVALERGLDLILIDGAPGIGCPVIASVTGVDLGVIVTEPSMSGLHDMERALHLLRHFDVQPLIVINKYDLNIEMAGRIREFCDEEGVEVAALIPFDEAVVEAMLRGLTIIEYESKGRVSEELRRIWSIIQRFL